MAWGFFKSIQKGLTKTREKFGRALSTILLADRKVDQDFLEELEAALIGADLGPRLAAELVKKIEKRYHAGKIEKAADIPSALKEELEAGLRQQELTLVEAET
ncbi:MAG: signal recognition particle receptor subunit alpha, partial [Planctomycetes bacterium]|nr:signal recognition particle receptor subunit alpha [Planctomycetota bacterium]